MKAINLFFGIVAIGTTLGFDAGARMLNRVTCTRSPVHYIEALSHESIKGIPNCLKYGYKAAHEKGSKLAKGLEALYSIKEYGPALAAIIYMREEALMKQLDPKHKSLTPFVYGETAYLYGLAFEVAQKRYFAYKHAGSHQTKRRHYTKGTKDTASIADQMDAFDLGDVHENLLSLLEQVADNKIRPDAFQARIELLIGKEAAQSLRDLHKGSEELKRVKALKHHPRGQASPEDLLGGVDKLRSEFIGIIEELVRKEILSGERITKEVRDLLRNNFQEIKEMLEARSAHETQESKTEANTASDAETRVGYLREKIMTMVDRLMIELES